MPRGRTPQGAEHVEPGLRWLLTEMAVWLDGEGHRLDVIETPGRGHAEIGIECEDGARFLLSVESVDVQIETS